MKKMTGKRIKKCNRRFFTVYGVVVVIAALAVVFGYSYIRTILTEYESVQTKYVADEAFGMFRDLDYEALFAYETPENRAKTDVQGYAVHAASLLAGKEITYRDSYRGDGEMEKIYHVYADGKRFATFTIRKSGEATAHGIEKWTYETASINLLENAFQEYRLECYADTRVLVNGVEVLPEQMTEIGELEGYREHLKNGAMPPKKYEYMIPDVLEAPEVSAVDIEGNALQVEVAGNTYSIGYPFQDAQMKTDREEWILQTAMSISEYTLGHASMNTIGRRVDPHSVAYQYVSKIDTSIIFNHKSYRFENARTENYVQFSDDCFSVDVYYDFAVEYYEKPRTYNTAYRFFFHKVNNVWMLYDFITMG